MPKTKAKETTPEVSNIVPPIAGGAAAGQTSGEVYAAPREGHVHSGVDVPVPAGTGCFAPVDGKIVEPDTTEGFSGGGMIHFEFTKALGNIPQGGIIGWGHVESTLVPLGPVKGGTKIATSGAGDGGDCVHFIYLQNSSQGNGYDGVEPQLEQPSSGLDPTPIYEFLRTGKSTGTAQNGPGEVGGGTASGISAAQAQSISKAAALAAFINLPGLMETTLSLALKGERSLMNDKPLLPFVEQLCQGSLRNFMSMPNGNFYAFIPDYFGGLTGRSAYWQIHDIEILSGEIQLSDEALATHVYVVGDTGTFDQTIDVFEKVQTLGVITVFNAFMADFLNGINDPTVTQTGKPTPTATKEYNQEVEKVPSLAEKSKAIAFLEKYGARPYYEEAPMIRSHYFETFLAYQLFCLLWSKQFLTTFELTFMPELFPGGLVQFPEHGIQCYVDEVEHTGDNEGGFHTTASLSAPSALKNGNKEVNAGMIRAGIFNSNTLIEPNESNHGNSGKGRKR